MASRGLTCRLTPTPLPWDSLLWTTDRPPPLNRFSTSRRNHTLWFSLEKREVPAPGQIGRQGNNNSTVPRGRCPILYIFSCDLYTIMFLTNHIRVSTFCYKVSFVLRKLFLTLSVQETAPHTVGAPFQTPDSHRPHPNAHSHFTKWGEEN